MNNKKYSYVPDFLVKANNVYRTRYYIVKQQLTFIITKNNEAYLISNDTYYKRTAKRDFEYSCFLSKRYNLDGKRIASSTYTRKYED